MIDLTVVIVSFNSADSILSCLKSVVTSKHFNVIIVDNCSSDNSQEKLQSTFPSTTVVQLSKNEGYGRAANAGFSKAASRFCLLLNPDINVSEKDIIEFYRLATSKNNEKNAIFAPAITEKQKNLRGINSVNFVLGAAMLIDFNKYEKRKIFDENIFLFYEEKDLCLRTVHENKQILRLNDIYFPHIKGTSSGTSPAISYFKQWHVGWSSMYFLKKHQLNNGRHSALALYVRYSVKRFLSFSKNKRMKYKARLGGVSAFLRGQAAFDKKGNPRMQHILKR
ncbi:glycosyltransferase [Marinibactrum halimedae]|uniref:Glycosyltransferase 2-like domain-containing protein n=1 Tax=Marinibactrum halimedae TaxID=1444977 RepID=A0AA37T8I6_9GAMM|nr:glycosyltransferase [Marinibactrum halimedae]MCD9460464.1 glycosyltransferase [Marinibactrum halimedae]GLS25871.1 hypothetical protein GCM10007877_15850 [Marinibactrum halimedae]